jgi:WD40 repeat protein
VIHQGGLLLAIRFAPDGTRLATGDLSGNTEFWDAATGKRALPTLGGQNGPTISVTFDPTGTEVLTTSGDGKLRLFDLASGQLVGAPLPGSGTYFPDAKQVVTVFGDGTGIVWNVDPAAWRAQACAVAHRNLTRAEWQRFLPERPYGRACP